MNKFFTRFIGVTAGLMLCASMASAAARFPNASCPDSVTLPQIQNPNYLPAICHAVGSTSSSAPVDTVAGLGGIIIGFDSIPTGFDVYIENRAAGTVAPWSGIDVFMHGTNFKPVLGLNLGDSLAVSFAGVAYFQGLTEVEACNNLFSAPNIGMRKVNSGNSLPNFLVGTTTQLKELPTNTFAEQYKSQLVRIVGPLTVVRTSLQPPGIGTSNSFLVVSASAPSDSVFIEGTKLTTYTPPAIGTTIDQVQGILSKATRGFRILLRDGNDIQTRTPPGVADAYPLTDNTVRVIFDRDVTPASATNTSNYSLGSFGTVDGAVMDGTGAVILTINNGLNHGDSETINVNNIVGSFNGLAMTSVQSKTIVNGVLSCAEVQAPNPDSLIAGANCFDRSRFAGASGKVSQGLFGPKMSMKGTCIAQYGNLYYLQDPGNPVRGGMTVFAPPGPLTIGHSYFLAGQTQMFFSETEFTSISDIRDLGVASIADPVTKTVKVIARDTCDVAQNIDSGRDWLSNLVNFHSVKVVQRFATLPTNGFHVAGENPAFADTIFIENLNNVLGAFASNNPNYPALNSVCDITGVVHYTSGSFRVCPRSVSDISVHGINVGVTPGAGKLAFSVFPNPSRNAKIAYTLPVASDVELGVYDVLGRQVVELAKGKQAAGSYQSSWNGKDASGKQVGSGVYFYRLRAGSEVRTTRAVLLGN